MVLINGALFLDLYLIMRNPFYPRSSRETRYYLIIFVIFLLELALISYQVHTHGNGFNLTAFKDGGWFLNFHRHSLEAVFVAIILLAVGIMVKLRYQGKGSNLKKKILTRHIAYLALFLIVFLYTILELYSTQIY